MELDLSTFEELKEMSGADFIDELIDTYLEDAPKLVSDMEAALQTGNVDAFRRAAHSLKSNSATFGAMHLSGLAKELEMLARENKLDEAGQQLPPAKSTLQAVMEELKGLHK